MNSSIILSDITQHDAAIPEMSGLGDPAQHDQMMSGLGDATQHDVRAW